MGESAEVIGSREQLYERGKTGAGGKSFYESYSFLTKMVYPYMDKKLNVAPPKKSDN